MDTNISIIRLIQTNKLDVSYEISNIRAGKNINIYIRKYLNKTDQYKIIRNHIEKTKTKLTKSNSSDNSFYENKLLNMKKVEKDFIVNTLYLAEALSKINPQTDKLKKAIRYFVEGEIIKADNILNEADLLNDQSNLIIFVEYEEHKIKRLKDELRYFFSQG